MSLVLQGFFLINGPTFRQRIISSLYTADHSYREVNQNYLKSLYSIYIHMKGHPELFQIFIHQIYKNVREIKQNHFKSLYYNRNMTHVREVNHNFFKSLYSRYVQMLERSTRIILSLYN